MTEVKVLNDYLHDSSGTPFERCKLPCGKQVPKDDLNSINSVIQNKVKLSEAGSTNEGYQRQVAQFQRELVAWLNLPGNEELAKQYKGKLTVGSFDPEMKKLVHEFQNRFGLDRKGNLITLSDKVDDQGVKTDGKSGVDVTEEMLLVSDGVVGPRTAKALRQVIGETAGAVDFATFKKITNGRWQRRDGSDAGDGGGQNGSPREGNQTGNPKTPAPKNSGPGSNPPPVNPPPAAPPPNPRLNPQPVGNEFAGCIDGLSIHQMTEWHGGAKHELRIMSLSPELQKSTGLLPGDVLDMNTYMQGRNGNAIDAFKSLVRENAGKSVNLTESGISVRRFDGKPGFGQGRGLTLEELQAVNGINLPVGKKQNISGLGLHVAPWTVDRSKIGIDICELDERLPPEAKQALKESGPIRAHIVAFKFGTDKEWKDQECTVERLQETVQKMKVGDSVLLTIQVSPTETRNVLLAKRYGVADASSEFKSYGGFSGGYENTYWNGLKTDTIEPFATNRDGNFKW